MGTDERFEQALQMSDRIESLIEDVVSLKSSYSQRRTNAILNRHGDLIASMDGRLLETDYARKAASIFGTRLRRLRVVSPGRIEEALDEHLSREEVGDVFALDVVASGVLVDRPEQAVYLAIEVSSVVDEHDVARSVRRSELLAKAGFPAIPVVAGRAATAAARPLAASSAVVLVHDGQIEGWNEAVARWL
jgi:hypothetical protein